MRGHCLPCDDPTLLQPSYGLIYRGLSEDAQREQVTQILSSLLRLSTEATAQAMHSPPLHLASNPDRERVRKHQRGLANLGCISSIESLWTYRHWSLDSELHDRYVLHAEAAPAQAFSLLRFSPIPGHARLQEAAKQCQDVAYRVLNHGDVLLYTRAENGAKLRQAVSGIKAHLLAQAGIDQCQVALGLFPQDGQHLNDLLDCLDSRLQTATPPATSAVLNLGDEHSVGGSIWLQMVRSSPDATSLAEKTHLSLAQCQNYWPTLYTPEAVSTTEIPGGLSRWKAAKAARLDAAQRLKAHCHRLDQLPSLPAMVMQVYQLAQDQESSGAALAKLVEQDPSLSTRLLALVNSSWFGLRARVDSIEHALVVIGREELAHLALQISSEKIFRGLSSPQAQALWRHSSRVAETARALGRRCEHDQLSSLFTAGLLHDMGKILLLSFEAEQMKRIAQKSQELGLPGFEIEREIWGHDHARLGAVMLAQWGLPAGLCQLVEQHHGRTAGGGDLHVDAALIALADHLSHRMDNNEPQGDPWRLRRTQTDALKPLFGELTSESMDLLCEDLREHLREPLLGG